MTARLTEEEIKDVVGALDDVTIAEIAATGATLSELEEAAALAAGESDVMGDLRKRASPRVAAVYELLRTEAVAPEQRD
jgi:hypothetical protein